MSGPATGPLSTSYQFLQFFDFLSLSALFNGHIRDITDEKMAGIDRKSPDAPKVIGSRRAEGTAPAPQLR
jgi:hypothetical protein